jgi:hypothetical protein
LIIQDFRGAAGDEAGGQANEGRGKLALVPGTSVGAPLYRMACRDTLGRSVGEQDLLAHIIQAVDATGAVFSRAMIVNYYVSLKTNPFVILTGAEGHVKTELARRFAEALVGRASPQYTLIPGGSSWHNGTGEDRYYRSLQERFSSWRFIDLLQEAADPSNAGKAYFVCFDGLHPGELEYYFATLLQITPDGEKRLNLPGFPADRQPTVPPNVYITATVDTGEHKQELSPNVLRCAGLIEFRTAGRPLQTDLPASATPPPVGYQRLWLRAAVHETEIARARIATFLGHDQLTRLGCSPDLARLLWRGGLVLRTQMLHELTTYIANSFDELGRGLFDPHDPQRNARIAFDAQVVQRMLWRLRTSNDSDLRHDLADYLDRSAQAAEHQAVA